MPVTATSWKKGQSGNLAGRKPYNHDDIPAYARQFGREAVDTMVKCLRDPKWKLPAAIALLDRGFGKPVQQLVGDPNTPIAFEIVWGPARSETPVIEANADESTEIAEAEVVWGTSSDAPSD